MEVSWTHTEENAVIEKETPSKEFLEAPLSIQDTEPTQSGTPRGAGLTIDIPPDDGQDSDFYSEDSVDLSDEESKGLTPTQLAAEKARTAIRLMRGSTKTFAKGDKLDKQVGTVLEDLCSY